MSTIIHKAATEVWLTAPRGRREKKTNKLATLAIPFLFIAGLFFPTSIDGQISKNLQSAAIGIALIFLVLLIRANFHNVRRRQLILALLVIGILLFFTVITPTREYAFGAILPFFIVSVMGCVNLRSIPYTRGMEIVWLTVNFIMLGAATAVVLEYQPFKDFLVVWYSAFYPELVPTMLEAGKPVVTFATHSYAAYFFYLFFFLNLKRYQATGSIIGLILALLFLGYLWPLRCVASSVLLIAGSIQLLIALLNPKRTAAALVAALGVLLAIVTVSDSWSLITNTYRSLLTDPSSGFLGRFGGGQLQPTIDYIAANPHLGVGLGYSAGLFFGDSGILVMVLRGSLPLLLTFYFLIWGFFAGNLSRAHAISAFCIFLAFEIGMVNLCYVRTQCFLPFFVVYMNGLAGGRDSSRAARSNS